MSGVGYGQFAPYLAGQATLEEVVSDIKRATRRFVRHQANWFRHDDARIHWLEAAAHPDSVALDLVQHFLALSSPRDPVVE
jgi:tRNA dimethylallyltransferase